MFANEGHTDWITVSVLLSRMASDIVSERAGISMTQYRLLIRVLMSESPSTVSEVADDLGLSASTITNALNGLERLKAIRRLYDASDKRVVRIEVLPEGRDLVSRIDPGITDLAHSFWEVYSDEELEMTRSHSASTAKNFRLAYVSGGELSVENAYIDSAWVISTELARHMRRANVSLNEYRVLYLVYETSEGMKPSDISRRLLLRSNEVTAASSKLEAHGRLERRRNVGDRRSCTLHVTERGVGKLERITPGVLETLRFNICDLEDGSFERYDSIARKILSRNSRIHLLF